MIKNIKEQVKKIKQETDILYLIQKINNDSGLFVLNNKILFAEINDKNENSESVETEYLTLKTNIEIVAVVNAPTFKTGRYNFIFYKNSVEDEEFESFVNLCVLYSNNNSKDFSSFFYSIYNLFQKNKAEKYKNLVGLWGELKFIDSLIKMGFDITCCWHKNISDKYDFVFKNCLVELKSTTNNEGFIQIKHGQLFSDDKVFLVVCEMEQNNAGEALITLVNELKSNKAIKNNFGFLFALEKEMAKIYRSDAERIKFTCGTLKIYPAKELPTIENIPDNISDISYKYNYLGLETMSLDEFSKQFKIN